MAILIDENTRCLVQGITGREAQIRTKLMLDYGTRIVAGVTPGRGGMKIEGVPVYNTVEEAMEYAPEITASVIFVPAPLARTATLEALDAGIKFVALIPERVPHQDMLELIDRSRDEDAVLIGPNTIGLVSPNRALIGIIGGRADLAREWFKRGSIGVLSRSGGQTTTVCYMLTVAGMGQSTAVGIGGDPFVGTNFADLLPRFEEDDETKALAIFGEIGTTQEEDAAKVIERGGFTKPLVAYVAGRWTLPGMRFGHAGAIVEHGRGSVKDKVEALRNAGAIVVDHLDELPRTVEQAIGKS